MSVRVDQYVRADGSIPYRTWFLSLDPRAAAKVAVATVRLSLGNTSSVKWFEGIGEYVIDWGPGYRVYLAKDGNELIILYGGGTKGPAGRYRAREGAARRIQGTQGRREAARACGLEAAPKEEVRHAADP